MKRQPMKRMMISARITPDLPFFQLLVQPSEACCCVSAVSWSDELEGQRSHVLL